MGKSKILRFSSIYSDRNFHIKDQKRNGSGDHDHSMVGETVLVSDYGASSPRFSCSISSKCFDNTVQQGITTSLVSENETAGSSFIGEAFRYTELPSEVTKLILESWRPSTRSRYESVLKRWHRYAISRNEDPYSPDVNTVLTFMHGMYLYGCLYSGLCAAHRVVTIRRYLKLSEYRPGFTILERDL